MIESIVVIGIIYEGASKQRMVDKLQTEASAAEMRKLTIIDADA